MGAGLDLANALPLDRLVRSAPVRDCLGWFSKERQWINELHLQLCRIAAPTFLEQKRAEWVLAQLRTFGYTAEIDRAGNVVARQNPGNTRPLLSVSAHLDTVLAPRRPEDVFVAADGTFQGPGVADNGAGLAALLALARAFRLFPVMEGAHTDLVFVANVGEEGEGNLSGMRYLCRQSALAERIRAFVVLDGPAVDHITCQALASRRFEVMFSGPGGHSWTDYGIANPVHALSRAISRFADEFPAAEENGSPRSSFNFGTLEGGASINSIPSSARAKVDIRSESPARIDEHQRRLTAAVEYSLAVENQRATGGKLTARVREIGSRPGGQLPPDAAVLNLLRGIDSFLGIKAHLDCASTDANIPLSLGLPAVSIGAGGHGGGAHTPTEWYSPEGRDLGLKRIVLLLAFLTGAAGSATMAE